MKKISIAGYTVGLGLTAALLTGCGLSSTPGTNTQNLPSNWNVQFELGTINLPDNPNQKSQSDIQHESLIQHLKNLQLHSNALVSPQGVSNQYIQSFLQFSSNNQAATSDLVVTDSISNSAHVAVRAGESWDDTVYQTSNNSQPLTLNLQYQGQKGSITRTLDRNNKLPLAVFSKLALTNKTIDASWGDVPGARSYLLQVFNTQGQLQANYWLDGSTTSISKTLPQAIAANSNHQVLLLAFAYQAHLTYNTKLSLTGKPNVSLQSKTVSSTMVPGVLASYSPTSLSFKSATWNNSPEQNVVLKAGAEGLDYSYTITSGTDHFMVNGNTGSLGGSATGNIPVWGTCSSSEGEFKGELTILTSDPAKKSIKVPLSITCTQPGNLNDFTFLNSSLNTATELSSTTTVNATVSSQHNGLQYSLEVLSGSNFITVPTGVTVLSSYASGVIPIKLTCSNTATTLTGKIRLKTNDPARSNIDFDVNLKCFTAPLVKTLWSKPNNLSVAAAAWNPSGTVLAVADNNYNDGAVLLSSSLKIIGKTSKLAAVPGKFSWLSDTRLVINSRDAVQVWDTTTSKSLHAWSHDFAADNVFSMNGNPSRDQIAISGQLANGGLASIVYGLDGQKVSTLNNVNNLIFSPDGQQVAGFRSAYNSTTSNFQHSLVIYNTSDFKLLKDIDVTSLTADFNSGFRDQLQWDPSSTVLFANVMEYYGSNAKLLTYNVKTQEFKNQPLKNLASVNFAVPSTDSIVYVDGTNQLTSYTLSTQQETKKVRLPVFADFHNAQITTDQQVNNITAFSPEGSGWGNSCSLQDLARFNTALDLQDTYGIASCEEYTDAVVTSTGDVYASNGFTARKISNGKTSALYDLSFLLNNTQLYPTHAIRENTGYFTDNSGYLYLYDLSKNSLIRSLRIQTSGMQQIQPSADNKRLFSWSNSTIRVHDLSTANILLNKSFDDSNIAQRWTGPDSILIRAGQDSNNNNIYNDYDFVKDQVNHTYTAPYWSYYLRAINDEAIFMHSDYNITRIDRQSGNQTSLLNQDNIDWNNRWNVDNLYALPRPQHILAVVHNTATPAEYRVQLLDATTGTVMKTLVTGFGQIRSISSALDTSGHVLISVLFRNEGLQVYQIN